MQMPYRFSKYDYSALSTEYASNNDEFLLRSRKDTRS